MFAAAVLERRIIFIADELGYYALNCTLLLSQYIQKAYNDDENTNLLQEGVQIKGTVKTKSENDSESEKHFIIIFRLLMI